MAVNKLEIRPIKAPEGSAIDFGVEIYNAHIENLSQDDFDTIRDAVYRSSVVVLKDQVRASAKAQYELTRRFDPAADSYGHGKTLDAKRSILHPDLKTIPHQPQVQVIGNGHYDEYEGLHDFTLKHPHHRVFHRDAIPDVDDLVATRFYRWHIDAALYDLNPPKVTSLLAVKVPGGRRQTLRYDDGTGDEMTVPLGTTAFVSGSRMYELLSEEDKAFVRTSRVEYAPHPYIWMSAARSRPDGLGLFTEGRELLLDQLPPIESEKVKILPMCWRNPVTGKLALQVHPSAVRALHVGVCPDVDAGHKGADEPVVIRDLKTVRERLHGLQRPGIAPPYVYAHDWAEGDMVLFHNQGVTHSVVGAFAPEERRLFRQCNMASSEGVLGPDGRLY